MATATLKAPAAAAAKAAGKNIGHITQVIGSTFDVEFAEDALPGDLQRRQGRKASTRA